MRSTRLQEYKRRWGRVVVDPVLVICDHLLAGLLHLRRGVLVLEVQVVLLVVRLPELGRRDVRAKLDLTRPPS